MYNEDDVNLEKKWEGLSNDKEKYMWAKITKKEGQNNRIAVAKRLQIQLNQNNLMPIN